MTDRAPHPARTPAARSERGRTRRSHAAPTALLALALMVSACGAEGAADPDAESSPVSGTSQASVKVNVPRRAREVQLERRIRVRVTDGTLSEVTLTGPKDAVVKGRMSSDRTQWVSTSPLQAGTRYRLSSTATDAQGRETERTSQFRTRELSLDEQTYASIVPLNGQTVGVGMPVIIRFDVPVTDRASIEKRLSVVSRPAQAGSFHWLSSQEVRWRPREYWKPGTTVNVKADIGGVPAGDGIFGQTDRAISFTVGRSMVSKVDMNTLQMRVFRDGRLIRTLPVTTGEQPKFTTRSGTKVIIEKFRRKRMNSETIGIDPESADGYDLEDVEYAMRVTYSGEFIHAAPWSVASQGRANVSHGCTGLSTDNARWLYDNTIVGDVVQYVGTDRGISIENGFGDWNASWADYAAGSSLS